MPKSARFAFGKNWISFLSVADERRAAAARDSLSEMLGSDHLDGHTLLDVGCGSGLFSLAAIGLGAARVHSFDYDPDSVACAHELKARFEPDMGSRWTIERGDILDGEYVQRLGQWDVVYSWGVLHHTGNMMGAMASAASLVKPGGHLFISIYNDQGFRSRYWKLIKKTYNSGALGKWGVVSVHIPHFILKGLGYDALHGRNPWLRYAQYRQGRGMSVIHDCFDWLGGYPFEVATPERVFDFFWNLGFSLRRLRTCGGSVGCNQFVFQKGSERTNAST